MPLLLTVTGHGGKVLYSNRTAGLDASLQGIALLHGRSSAWWVDDQVPSTQGATGAAVRVGTGSGARSGASPSLATSAPSLGETGGVSVLNATVVNHSATAQGQVPVFAVAVRGGRVVAAGRAVVPALAGRAGASAAIQVFLIGNPAGAQLELTAVPTAG